MRHRRNIFGVLIFVIMIGVGVFFGIQFLTKTGVFKVPGVVKYDESLSEVEKGMLEKIFTNEVVLDKDVTISGEYSFTMPSSKANEYLYDVYVPVTDYYSVDEGITVDRPENVFADAYQAEVNFEMIPINELSFKQKLLKLNDAYYLDELDKGAVFRVIKFDSESFEEEIKPLVADVFAKEWPEKDNVLSFAQTGVTALARGMNRKLSQVGDAKYFAEKISGFLSGFDLTHTSNEASFTELATADNICSDPRFIDTLTAIGTDIIELTGNHNVDCGAVAANGTIDLYRQNNIQIVGGGKNATEAAVPLNIDEKNNGITFLAYNQSTGGATLGEMPGANQYYEENALAEIKNAKEKGNFVIVDIQYYECSAYASEYEDTTCDYANSSAGDQVGFFRHLIDLGADMVVGTSAHQPQTFELYGDGVIYYGLGNLFFDQVWWPDTTRSLVLAHYFNGSKLLQTRIMPTYYDASMQTQLMDAENAKAYLQRLINVRP